MSLSSILDKTISHLSYRKKYKPFCIYESEISQLVQTSFSEEAALTFPDKFADSKKDLSEHIVSEKVTKPIKVKQIEKWMSSKDLLELEENINNCSKCSLSGTRKSFVFGTGNHNAEIVVIGEAPGADEDEQGKPFVGRAGQLLTKILEAVEIKREDVFICNILKCRPPNNRNPLPEEIEACEGHLKKQLDLIKPRFILALGTFAAQTLLGTKEPLGKLRGRFHSYNGIKTMVTFHPAALLRNPNWKKPTWEDIKLLKKEYDNLK